MMAVSAFIAFKFQAKYERNSFSLILFFLYILDIVSTFLVALVPFSSNNIYGNNNESEKEKGMLRVRHSLSNIHDVDGVVCQLVSETIRDGMIQLQQVL